MLVAIEASGTKPPLFFVHGGFGILFSIGSNFARALGPDQPVYVLHANGMDGRQPVMDNMQQMVIAYFEQIQRVRPIGSVRIGGMCAGCLIAIEIARRMQEKGRETGPVILADPPVVPFRHDKRSTVDPRQPQIADRLYREVRSALLDKVSNNHDDLPFDPADAEQLHAATLAGVGMVIASAGCVPSSFSGPVEVIISAARAPGFFHPLMPWQKLLTGPRVVHVLPWSHNELFGAAGRKTAIRLIRSTLEEAPPSESPALREVQPALA